MGASCVVKSEVPGRVPRLSNAYDSKTRPSQLHRSSPSASGSEARETGSYQRQLLARGRNKNTPPATKVDLAVVACWGLFFSDTYINESQSVLLKNTFKRESIFGCFGIIAPHEMGLLGFSLLRLLAHRPLPTKHVTPLKK